VQIQIHIFIFRAIQIQIIFKFRSIFKFGSICSSDLLLMHWLLISVALIVCLCCLLRFVIRCSLLCVAHICCLLLAQISCSN
jgi:hypothetical protein